MLNPLDLREKHILVTGASSGIGKATAILLSQLGARIAMVARNEVRLAETLDKLDTSFEANHSTFSFDLSRYTEIPDWLSAIASAHGGFDGLVHCAGIQMTAPLKILDLSQIPALMDLNINAALALAKAFRIKKNRSGRGGSIVLLSSVVGQVGQPAVSVYAASKGALIAAAKSLAVELARENIRVNAILPGHVETEMAEEFASRLTTEQLERIKRLHPLGLGAPEDIANAIAYLQSDGSKWVTGSELVVDGGYTAW